MVEDNPGDAELTKETLESGRVACDVAVVFDGAEAIAYLRRDPPYQIAPRPDLILLDLNLPKLDGHAVLSEVKQHPALSSIPVVVLTTSDAGSDIDRSYQLGANCYVTKPVGAVAFQATVRAVEDFWFTAAKLPS